MTTHKRKKSLVEKLPICYECGEEFDPKIELFRKYHKGNICFNCSRERFEDEIGYESN